MHQHIIITGPESSGKTTLANSLADELGCDLIAEYAREYIDIKGGLSYSEDDIERIAEYLVSQKIKYESRKVLFDTSFLVLKIWLMDKFQSSSDLIDTEFACSDKDIYLLCKPNIPWVDDPLRENPEDRDRLFELYHRTLDSHGMRYHLIEGDREERTKKALRFVLEDLE